jgi:transposase
MAITLPDARQLSDDVLEALRLRALNGRELGFTEADLANLLGVSRETVCRWWSVYTAHGLDALPQERTGRPLGSGRLLSDQQASDVQRLLDEKNPEDLGIPHGLRRHRIASIGVNSCTPTANHLSDCPCSDPAVS